ncbi:hypothetical protein [Alistipes sp.]|uniref:hypothetical protein n=1 Tax=Alistipes sp. TaxID=1872444 RepID=UPI0025BD65AF|nr:hypothetical protein [Alistipes sp.]
MKKLLTILVLSSAMLSACEGDPEFAPKTSVEAKIHELMTGYDGKIHMSAFIADAQRGVWLIDDIDITYTNGKTESGVMDGAALMNNMMLLPNGVCRTFSALMYIPGPIVYFEGDQWSVSREMKNTLVLYNPGIEENAKTANYDQYAARTTLELLYYKDGVFVMEGLQPFAYMGGWTSEGVYSDYCRVVGHIATDKATVDRYLSYISYKQYKEENPDKF